MRLLGRLQDRCQTLSRRARRILREKFSSRNENPHGFELPRTLWCRSQSSDLGSQNYRLTVTLSVPTLPLLSNERSETVCSPGASGPKSTE